MVSVSVDGIPFQVFELDNGTATQPLDLQYMRLNIGQRVSFVLDFSRMDPALLSPSAIKIRFSLMAEMYNQFNASASSNQSWWPLGFWIIAIPDHTY